MVDFIERTDHSDVIAMALHSFESAFICCNSLKKTFMLDLLVTLTAIQQQVVGRVNGTDI